MKVLFLLIFFFLIAFSNAIYQIEDIKEMKRILKANPSVLILFARTEVPFMEEFEKAVPMIFGKGKLAYIDCNKNKRLCMGSLPKRSNYALKYFLHGKEDREYPSDRPLKALSFRNFMLNPDSKPTWEELDTSSDIIHLDDETYEKILNQRKPTLIFFHSPSCAPCEQFKPAFSAAATALKGKAIFAAVDSSSKAAFRTIVNSKLTAFPTIKYFENGVYQFDYGGKRTEAGIVEWFKAPYALIPPPKDATWSETLKKNDL